MQRNLTRLVRIRNFNTFQISQYSIYISQLHYKIEIQTVTRRPPKGRQKGRKGMMRGGKMPSQLSVPSPTILQPLKLAAHIRKGILYINVLMMIINRKNPRKKLRRQRTLLSPKPFSTHMVEWEAALSACLRSGYR